MQYLTLFASCFPTLGEVNCQVSATSPFLMDSEEFQGKENLKTNTWLFVHVACDVSVGFFLSLTTDM